MAVTSGKGGVGKTNVVVNLAVALARLRNRVAILDADFGLGNVDVLLGLTPPHHLGPPAHRRQGHRRTSWWKARTGSGSSRPAPACAS